MKPRAALPVLLMLAIGTAGAQVYKWKDEKGVTHYSDTPPPPTAKQAAELKTYATGPATPALPSELQTIARDNPVTLYTTAQCAACDQGRAQLRKRGIPYQEKTVLTAADMEALKKAGSNGRLPLLAIGRTRQVGYDPATWDDALSAAGYPMQSLLPPNFAHAAPESAAPPPLPTDADRTSAASAASAPAAVSAPAPARGQLPDARRAAPPNGANNTPPNFQF